MNRTKHASSPGWLVATILMVSLCWLGSAWAEDISAVKVRGNKRVETDAIRVVLQSQPGDPLSQVKVASDIKAIFALGYFDDVRALLVKTDKGPVLTFQLAEKPSIAAIMYRGNEKVDDDKIKEVVDIKPLSVLDLAKIRKNADKIRELYIEKGYFLADVTHELKTQPNNSVTLIFVVDEHAKVEVKRLNFIGNRKISDSELKGNIETREGHFFSFLTSWGTYKEDGLKRDVLRVSEYYYNNGYLNVKVSDPIVEISRDRRHLFITIPVEEGEQYRIGNVSFSGDLLVDDSDLAREIERALDQGGAGLVLPVELQRQLQKRLKESEIAAMRAETLQGLLQEVEQRMDEGVWEEDQVPPTSASPLRDAMRAALLTQLKIKILEDLLSFEAGETFNKMKLGMSMFKVRDVYKDRGYAYADVIPETKIDSESRMIDLNFNVQKGSKVFIERIEIRGNLKTRDKVIRRQLRIYEGEYYSGRALEKSRRLVTGLGFFEKVDFTEKRGSGPDKIIINIDIKERQTGTFQIGAGFSSVENFIATAQISQQNLFGRGQTLALMAQLSSLRQFFSLQFVEPHFLDTKWYFATSVFNTQLDYINFLRKTTGGRLTLGYGFMDDWRVSFTYKLEKVDVSSGRGTDKGYRNANLFRDGWTSSVQASMMWDTRDNRLFPTDGHLLQGSAEIAHPYTLSDNVFLRFTGVARWYYPVIWGIVLKTNLSLGYISSMSDQAIPIFEKYFVGGIYTVRGFEPRSIGPQAPAADDGYDPGSPIISANVGGSKQLIANVEIEFPIFPQVNIRGVLFIDAGNAYGEMESFFDDRYSDVTGNAETWLGLYWSAGFGFRWFSPIGPLRFEWGIPITRRAEDKDMLFEFTIGNFF
jgi:outer membrane protein insertion porin family